MSMASETLGRTLYWAVAGGLMGVGLVAFGLAFLPFLIGAVLALYRLRRLGARGFWVALVAMGLLPALILIYDYATADGVSVFVPDSYLQIAALFLLIAVAGAVLGVVEERRVHTRHT